MSIGIQYDTVSGFIHGSCSPPLALTQILPAGRSQLIVDDGTSFENMKVDITQNPPVLIPTTGT